MLFFFLTQFTGDAWPTKTLNWVRPIFSDLGNVRLVELRKNSMSGLCQVFGFARLSFVRSAESPTISLVNSAGLFNASRFRWNTVPVGLRCGLTSCFLSSQIQEVKVSLMDFFFNLSNLYQT